ncbi:MAG: hypothetical protein HQM08_11520 [Candidatus Riflebacteria bacterium]|nr:hypothetical protein [Candidatus Riflebacteria bacterium]
MIRNKETIANLLEKFPKKMRRKSDSKISEKTFNAPRFSAFNHVFGRITNSQVATVPKPLFKKTQLDMLLR